MTRRVDTSDAALGRRPGTPARPGLWYIAGVCKSESCRPETRSNYAPLLAKAVLRMLDDIAWLEEKNRRLNRENDSLAGRLIRDELA